MKPIPRRQFLKLAGLAPALLAGVALRPGRSLAQDRLLSTDPTAISLKYAEDAGKIDPAAVPLYKSGRNCRNCMLYQREAEAQGYAPCAVFGGQRVAAAGWCAAWVSAE